MVNSHFEFRDQCHSNMWPETGVEVEAPNLGFPVNPLDTSHNNRKSMFRQNTDLPKFSVPIFEPLNLY